MRVAVALIGFVAAVAALDIRFGAACARYTSGLVALACANVTALVALLLLVLLRIAALYRPCPRPSVRAVAPVPALVPVPASADSELAVTHR